MEVRNIIRIMGLGAAMTAGLAVAGPVGAPTLAALARIEPGQWQFKPLDSNIAPRSVCVGDARPLLHFNHSVARCQHSIVANTTNLVSVSFVCPGAGHGLTTLKVATPRNFNLDTQGIFGGAPFDERYEARRTGDCSADTARLR